MTSVYVVVSDTFAHGHNYHGVHGVYKTKESAYAQAMSTIMGIVKHHGYNPSKDDITAEYDDFLFANEKVDIVVSCLEQRLS